MKEKKIHQIPVKSRELCGSYQTHYFLFLGLPQLNNFKSVWSFWSLLLRLVRTRAAFSLGLTIPCNWGKALLSTRYPRTWGFPVWLVGPGVVLALCEHRTLYLLVLSMAGSWSGVPHMYPGGPQLETPGVLFGLLLALWILSPQLS